MDADRAHIERRADPLHHEHVGAGSDQRDDAGKRQAKRLARIGHLRGRRRGLIWGQTPLTAAVNRRHSPQNPRPPFSMHVMALKPST